MGFDRDIPLMLRELEEVDFLAAVPYHYEGKFVFVNYSTDFCQVVAPWRVNQEILNVNCVLGSRNSLKEHLGYDIVNWDGRYDYERGYRPPEYPKSAVPHRPYPVGQGQIDGFTLVIQSFGEKVYWFSSFEEGLKFLQEFLINKKKRVYKKI